MLGLQLIRFSKMGPLRGEAISIYIYIYVDYVAYIHHQSAEMRLAVSGAQPLFTLGLLMFALSLVDFLSLLLSPSTDIKIFFIFVKSIIWWTHTKS